MFLVSPVSASLEVQYSVLRTCNFKFVLKLKVVLGICLFELLIGVETAKRPVYCFEKPVHHRGGSQP